MASPRLAPRGRGLTDAPAAPRGAGSPPWPVPTTLVVGPGTDGAVVLTGPQLAGSGQSRRFNAAFLSRSTTWPTCGQTRCLSIRPLPTRRHGAPSGWVQPWWIWLDGNQRSATVNRPPWRAVLYTSMGLIAPMLASETARRNARRPMPRVNGFRVEVGFHPGQAPVEREPACTEM